jgi:hypothetical protein
LDRQGIVAFFPSDHHFSDDDAFVGHMEAAYAAAASRTEQVVLPGIPPDSPEMEYGWIEPVVSMDGEVPSSVSPCEPILGETAPETCRGSDGARLSVEQLRHGWVCLPHLNPSGRRFLRLRERRCAGFIPGFPRPASLRRSCRCGPAPSRCFALRVSAGAISENPAVSSLGLNATAWRRSGDSNRDCGLSIGQQGKASGSSVDRRHRSLEIPSRLLTPTMGLELRLLWRCGSFL